MIYVLTHLILAAGPETTPAGDVVGTIIASVLSATVITGVFTGLITFLINRRNSRITERKNAFDAGSDIVVRYKEAAAEERAQKASAVATIKDLLAESKEQVEALKSTVETLTRTISILENLTTSQRDMIAQLTSDRDRAQAALSRAEARIIAQKEQLQQKQEEIRVLLAQTRTRDEAERIVSESFNLTDDVVE